MYESRIDAANCCITRVKIWELNLKLSFLLQLWVIMELIAKNYVEDDAQHKIGFHRCVLIGKKLHKAFNPWVVEWST